MPELDPRRSDRSQTRLLFVTSALLAVGVSVILIPGMSWRHDVAAPLLAVATYAGSLGLWAAVRRGAAARSLAQRYPASICALAGSAAGTAWWLIRGGGDGSLGSLLPALLGGAAMGYSYYRFFICRPRPRSGASVV
jgi:hypothetical protein